MIFKKELELASSIVNSTSSNHQLFVCMELSAPGWNLPKITFKLMLSLNSDYKIQHIRALHYENITGSMKLPEKEHCPLEHLTIKALENGVSATNEGVEEDVGPNDGGFSLHGVGSSSIMKTVELLGFENASILCFFFD